MCVCVCACLCACACSWVKHSAHVKIRRQLAAVSSLLLPARGSQGANSLSLVASTFPGRAISPAPPFSSSFLFISFVFVPFLVEEVPAVSPHLTHPQCEELGPTPHRIGLNVNVRSHPSYLVPLNFHTLHQEVDRRTVGKGLQTLHI